MTRPATVPTSTLMALKLVAIRAIAYLEEPTDERRAALARACADVDHRPRERELDTEYCTIMEMLEKANANLTAELDERAEQWLHERADLLKQIEDLKERVR